jgi:hypothetical protein
MFQSEHLQEKWAPLLNHEGCDKISDPHRRAVTAVLLENQEKFLREQSSFEHGGMLTEQPNINTDPSSTGNAGFSGSGASPVAGFDPVLIPHRQTPTRHSSTKQTPHSLVRTQVEPLPVVSPMLMLVWVLPKHK